MKRSRLIAAFLCGILLTGCTASIHESENGSAGQAVENNILSRIPHSSFPAFGGCRTLYYPGNLAAAAAGGCSFAEATERTAFTESNQSAWEKLENGELDIILAYEPDEETMLRLKEQGYLMQPIGADALVFLSGGTDTRSLTVEQLMRAYRGEDEWICYAGAPDSEARQMFLRVFGSDSVGQQLSIGEETITAACTHEENTLCYTSYLSMLALGQPEHTAIVAVDGILPEEQSILQTEAAGKYPLTVPYYVACRGGLPKNDETMLLFTWMTSPEGAEWITHTAALG